MDLAACNRNIYDWLPYNSLVFDPDKLEACMFGVSRRVQSLKSTTTQVTVSGVSISMSDHFKSFGVTSDMSLTFDQHTRKICKTSYFYIRGFRQVRAATDQSITNAVTSDLYHRQIQAGLLQCASSRHVWVEPRQVAPCPELPCLGGDRHTPSRSHQTSS